MELSMLVENQTSSRDLQEATSSAVLLAIAVANDSLNDYHEETTVASVEVAGGDNQHDWGWPLCVLPNVSYNAGNTSNNVNSSVSEAERFYLPLFEFVISLVLLVVVAIPGLVGNFISIFILSRPQMRTSLNIILIGLASFDSILLITSILLFVFPSIYAYCDVGEFYYRHIHPLITPYTFVLGMTAQTSSVYLTVTVTAERYIAVCHPLKARSWCTCKRGRLAVLVIGFFSLCYNLPRFFEVERCLYIDKELNESWVMVIPSNLRNNKDYITWYIVSLYFVVMNFVPFTLLAILNGAIYKQVREANRQRSLLTNSQKREIGLATMLLCVVAVFFIFNILAMVVNIFEAANILVDEMTRVSNLLVSVNSSVNFIIYCIFGDKFQRLFLRHFCCCCRPGRGRSQSGRSSPDLPENSISMGNTTQPIDIHRVTSTFTSRGASGRMLSIPNRMHHVHSNNSLALRGNHNNGCIRSYASGSGGGPSSSGATSPSTAAFLSPLATAAAADVTFNNNHHSQPMYRTNYGGGFPARSPSPRPNLHLLDVNKM